MRQALRLAQRAYGQTSPNPLVGAVLVKKGEIIGRGWHKRAGLPHAEVEALRNAERRGKDARGATLYVTLEPCCTQGRTPPCTSAIIAAGIKRVVVAATDPNPKHAGRAFPLLRAAGIEVQEGVLSEEATRLNDSFNHWIVHRTPFVTVKAAMSLDGKIATRTGESKWITGEASRAYAMELRAGSDAILVGINTVLADDPALILRPVEGGRLKVAGLRPPRRIVLDSDARTPTSARLVRDELASLTTIFVSQRALRKRVQELSRLVRVEVAPLRKDSIDLRWVMKKLGEEAVTSLLVEGGGEVNASFLFGGFAQRVALFYAPLVIGGKDSRKGVAGNGVGRLPEAVQLRDVQYRWLGQDLLLTGRVK